MNAVAGAVFALGIAATIALAQQRAPAPQSPVAVSPQNFARRAAMLTIEDAGIAGPADLQMLIDTARGAGLSAAAPDFMQLRHLAMRTLGRLERRDLVPALIAAPADQVRSSAEIALLLTLRAHAPSAGQDAEIAAAVDMLAGATASPIVLGHLPYSRRDQVAAAEARLRQQMERADLTRAGAARGLEALARRNRRLGALGEQTIALLKKAATWNLPDMDRRRDVFVVVESLAALVAAGAVDAEVLQEALRQERVEPRRLGAFALFSSGASLESDQRTELIRQALRDRDAAVRYDALRAWIRTETPAHGCDPILEALADTSMHVVLAAIDALADRCVDGEDAAAISLRLIGELRTPPNTGSWHREAHALVAAARRAPARARLAMPFFSGHPTWQVRMYAARAAGLLNDVATLKTLAFDSDHNVREAALAPVRRLEGADSDAALIAALGSDDYQLLRTAAMLLKGATSTRALVAALADALDRVTAQKKDTSRDTRLALIERIRELGGDDQVSQLERLLGDYDPAVAGAAAAAITAMAGRPATPAPKLLPRPPPPTANELAETLIARVELNDGRQFAISFDRSRAPLAYARFARLIRSGYYDGLTFHRVVPNFVVQGGSPGANEYAGDARFMRDELAPGAHSRGTVGISTRGRHTGDAQLFINLADNRRLDFEYTVVGTVTAGMDVVDTIQEGAAIRRIRLIPPTR